MKLNTDAPKFVERPISQFMTPDPVTLETNDKIAFALHKMNVGGYRHVPILFDGKLAGVISIRDILRYLTERIAAARPCGRLAARARVGVVAAAIWRKRGIVAAWPVRFDRLQCGDNSCHVASQSCVQQDVESTCSPDCRATADRRQPVEVQQAIASGARAVPASARELQTPQERRQQAELDRMIQSPHDKATLMQLTDQAFRSRRPHRAADQLIHILDVQGVPRFFSALDRTLLLGFQSFGVVSAGRGDAVRQGADAARDGERHPAGRARSCWPSICEPAGKKACG